jgi:hypothetical protein
MILRRENNSLRKAIRDVLTAKGAAEFLLWASSFYAEHQGWIRDKSGPLIRNYAAAVVSLSLQEVGSSEEPANFDRWQAGYRGRSAKRWTGSSESQLRVVLSSAEADAAAAALEARLAEWEEKRAGKYAARETIELGEASARLAYKSTGVRRLRWVTSGGACEYCQRMNGRVVGIDQHFVPRGGQVDGSGGPLNVKSNIGHPPLHGSCGCTIVADV